MNLRGAGPVLRQLFLFVVLALCLLSNCAGFQSIPWFRSGCEEMFAILRDPSTQWMLFLCSGMYLVALSAISQPLVWGTFRGSSATALERPTWSIPGFWLFVVLAAAAVTYALDYSQALRSTEALTLIGALMAAQMTRFLERRQGRLVRRWGGETVLTLLLLLSLAAVWHPDTGRELRYRNQARWTGPWDNPNTFGMLMAMGTVLVLGIAAQSAKYNLRGSPSPSEPDALQPGDSRLVAQDASGFSATRRWQDWLIRGSLLAAAVVMGLGLVQSYSRGAWVGLAVGLAYLAWARISLSAWEVRNRHPIEARGLSLWSATEASKLLTSREAPFSPRWPCGSRIVWCVIIGLACGVLGVWNFQHTEWLPARRAISVVNVNDFSWRNRVVAWEGALQMMAQKPWLGWGWNRTEKTYEQFYRPSQTLEGAAIQLNDYFRLGTTLGIPVLVCFAAYLWLILSRESGSRDTQSRIGGTSWQKAVCRSGAIVLVVGFWLDGGLFKLATAVPFWVLVDLGQVED